MAGRKAALIVAERRDRVRVWSLLRQRRTGSLFPIARQFYAIRLASSHPLRHVWFGRAPVAQFNAAILV